MAFYVALSQAENLRWLNLSGLLLCGDSFKSIFQLPQMRFLGAFKSNIMEDEVPERLRVAAQFSPEQVDTRDSVAAFDSFTRANSVVLGGQVHTALSELGTLSVGVAREALRALFSFLSPSGGQHESEDTPAPSITRDNGFTSLVIRVLERFEDDSSVQCYATANLFYLTARNHIADQSPQTRLQALHALLRLLVRLVRPQAPWDAVHQDMQVVKNCCLTLRNFLPETELSRCSCFVAITLLRAALDFDDRTVQHVALLMCCHNLASLHPHHKERIGSAVPASGISLVLNIIAAQHEELEQADEPDDGDFIILELGWTFLWNMTDETPSNVRRFLEQDGIAALLRSLTTFPNEVRFFQCTLLSMIA